MSFLSKINWRIILQILGFLLIIEGLFMFTGIPFSIYYCNYKCLSLLYSGLITLSTGGVIWFITRKANRAIGKREGYIIVSVAWVVISLFGTLPYLISGAIPSFTDAYFETISGFTTTGASILTDIEIVPKGLLFWRALTHWIGGMGIIVLSVAILPLLGIGGMQLFVAEMPGITPDKLHPRITQTAKRLWGIYLLLTAIETVLLMFGGMDLFDSLCHSFATMATGGFSTKNASVADFSPYIQYVIIVFMILAGTNFTLHYLGLHGKLREIWRNEEYRYYILFTLGFSVVLGVIIFYEGSLSMEQSIRDALFQVVSIVTTTGFVTSDYLSWPGQSWIFLFLLMFVGGSAGSTGGGIKIARQILLLKNSALEFKRMIHPQAVIPVRFNGRAVAPEIIHLVMAFFLFYILTFFAGTFILTLMGLSFDTAIGATIATLGNIGPGIGGVGPVENYSFLPDAAKWISSFLMLLGRLELFTVIILFSPSFWKK
ncbi:MAG TPA: potassium transporter TrkG [Bacteroidales bacterium]|nr:TrkH family potassium uptake protein [Bacteroidales bacterium]HPE55642.1 potassium transporter TrkG [Bacteroidales bacterium]HRX96217.1 potassium transporter TrkG [Bacteroidales bacterium]